VADPDPKDVVLAMFGASAGLGGLVLVFLGLVIASYQSVPADTPKSVKDRAKSAGPWIVVVFALSLATVALCLAWLAAPGGDWLYHVAIWVFAAELIAVFLLAVGMTRKMLS
jgi:uncharacterized membrane protein YdjX (TVP38/TMEM64 family)